jgi:integrase
MALSVRRRGDVWHARGTVRVGRETIVVSEFSTGARTRSAAEDAAAAEERRIREERLEGPAGRARRLTIAECITTYAQRPRGVAVQDNDKITRLTVITGEYTLDRLREAWAAWQAQHPTHSPGTATRYRALLMAAVRAGCEARDLPPPRLAPITRRKEDRIAHLTDAERAAMLRAYSPHAACPVLVLAYQGMRTREALRLTWRDVEWRTETIRIPAPRAKSGRGRAVPMHPRVRMLLWGMWHAAGRPDSGDVFLSSRGDPYADTKDVGGNPLAAAHRTACKRVRVKDFRVHDWRHDWACRMVLAGVDLVTLMELGGWASLSMVQRYATIRGDHRRDAIARLA